MVAVRSRELEGYGAVSLRSDEVSVAVGEVPRRVAITEEGALLLGHRDGAVDE